MVKKFETELIFDLEAVVDPILGPKLIRNKIKYPWSLGRPFREGHNQKFLRLIPQMAGAGFFSGDNFEHKLHLDRKAAVSLESAGASLILPGRKGPALINWEFHLKENARLILDAEPYLLINNAELIIKTKIFIDRSSIFLASDFLGHCFPDEVNYGSWQNEMKLYKGNGELFFIDSQKALPTSFKRSEKILGGYPSIANVWLIAPDLDCSFIKKIIPKINSHYAVTELRDGLGQVVRLLANDVGLLRDDVKSVLREVKKGVEPLYH